MCASIRYQTPLIIFLSAFLLSCTAHKPIVDQPIQKEDRSISSSTHKKIAKREVGRLAHVYDIRHWSNPDYTRVVIDVDRKVAFSKHLLKEDPDLNKPRRLYFDLKDTWIDPNLKVISIHDALLIQARAAQYTPDTVRVVLDIKTIEDYNVFSLHDPFRIVIDVKGKATSEIAYKREIYRKTPAKQPKVRIKRIVIDPGHGGKDPGALGRNGLKEKDVVLKVAKMLKKRIERIFDCEVFLTRNHDTFLSLEERMAIANAKKADLFISIHTNAHKNRNIHGIETYYLSPTNDKDALELAAKENGTSAKNVSDLQVILRDLILQKNTTQSSGLADCVQNCMVAELKRKYRDINNLGVKQAPFVVLMGAQMPSILIEVSFITNRKEATRLTDNRYLDNIAYGIVKGISNYITTS